MTDTPLLPANATLTTRMHEVLEAAIIAGELRPGERIHADVLAAQYGMSRIPVREALRSLHEAGWVEIKPRYGVHVRRRTAGELDELFQFRAVVEGLVARWAAERRTEADLRRLSDVVEVNRAALDDPAAGAASHFYAALRDAAKNAVLASTSTALEKRARFYFFTVAHELGEDWFHVHEQLLDHVRAQELEAAQKLACKHVEDTGTAVRALLFASP